MLKHSQIDFSLVQEIYNKISKGDYRQFMAREFPALEQDVAGLALIEQQNSKIAGLIRVEFAAKGLAAGLSGVIDHINDAYVELDERSKHMLLPLFFTGDMSEENTAYIPDKNERDAALMVFLDMINKDKLALDELKNDFVEEYPLGYLLPLHDHLQKGDKASDPIPKKDYNDGQVSDNELSFFSRMVFFLVRVCASTASSGLIFIIMPGVTGIELPGLIWFLLAGGAAVWTWYGLGVWWKTKKPIEPPSV
jgi:hypothetical protein